MAQPQVRKRQESIIGDPHQGSFRAFFDKGRRQERMAIWATILFITAMAFLIVYTDDVLYEVGIDITGAKRNRVLDCQKDGNRNTPYCLDRKSSNDSTWRSITRFGDQPKNAFTLHGK